MNLTSIFTGRTFNKEESCSVSSCSDTPRVNNIYKVWSHKKCKLVYPNEIDSDDDVVNYDQLMNTAYGYDENTLDDTDVDAESELANEYTKLSKKKKYLSRSAVNYEDNKLKLFDDFNEKLNKMWGEDDGNTLTSEDEIYLMMTYKKGDIYVDKLNNQVTVVEINNNNATIIVNAYLGKLRKDAYTLDRVTFLKKFDFKPGTITKDYS